MKKRLMSLLLTSVIAVSAVSLPISASAVNTTNPIIKGSYADPDIDIFGCKYWIYPTTDGNPGWSGTQFHAFSSDNLVDWTDEGVILDVADDNPSKNIKGVQIASSPWSAGNAWAPTIEEYGGKYYFYYCGRIKEEFLDLYAIKNDNGGYQSDKAIGVAVADNPAGPYVANSEPIVYPSMIENFEGQVIDPSIFIDDDGTKYMFFGNGIPYVMTLNGDMLSGDASSVRRLNGLKNFRESVVVFKRNGLYHFTWSCDDTASENYHIEYGTTRKLSIAVQHRGTILEKDTENSIFGTGHQSILYLPKQDKCFIAYARHQTKNGVSVNDPGNFRETCINELTFDSTGYLNPVKPTNSATSYSAHIWDSGKVTKKASCIETGVKTYTCLTCGETRDETLAKTGHTAVTDKAIEPTFAKEGKTAGSHCSVCKKVITPQKAVAKLKPSATTVSKVTAGKKAFTVKWKKQTKNTTGYQVQYSTDKNFNKESKTVTVTKNKTTSLTVKKLKAKKKYYVRIRTYKTYSGKKYYSSWSKSKTVTTKK